jgi:hypothetical protein
MIKGNKIVLAIIAFCCIIFIGGVATVSFFISKYSKYDMKMGESPDLYIVCAAGANLSSASIQGAFSEETDLQEKAVKGIFSLILPDDSGLDVRFSTQNISGIVLSKAAFDAYDDNGGAVKKIFLPGFKAAILDAKMIAMLYNSAKQSEGKPNNAYAKFETFKKENGVAPNAAVRVAYSDLSCIDYVPVDISYERIGEIFGLTKLALTN